MSLRFLPAKQNYLLGLSYLVLALTLIYFLLTHSPNLDYDTPSYVNFGPYRPLLYPFFIWSFKWMGVYQFQAIMWVQAILIFTTLIYARNWFVYHLNLSSFAFFLIFLFVLFTISFHYQILYIQSEGLTFPLFILTFLLLIECFQKYTFEKICILAVFASLLVLLRLQFCYFYILFFILLLWYVWQKIPFKSLLKTAGVLFSSILLTFLIDHSYHFLKHGFWGGAPYGQVLVMAQTTYLADDNAIHYFKNEKEKGYIQKLIQLRNSKQLNKDAELVLSLKPSRIEYAYQAYSKNYIELERIIADTFKVNDKVVDLNAYKVLSEINQTIFLNEIKKNMLFLVWKFIKCMGGITLFLFYILLFVILTFQMIKQRMKQMSMSFAFLWIAVLVTFFNAAIIAVCNPDLPCYFCYSQFMFYSLAAFLASHTFKRMNNV